MGPGATTVETTLGLLTVRATGSGPTAVLWHSLFVDSSTWARVEQSLAADRRLLLVDGPGHGANPVIRRRFTMDDCTGAAVQVLDHLGVGEPVDWLGNAWGGHVGILFAADHPERCRSLICVSAPVPALTLAERRRIRLLRGLYAAGGAGPVTRVLVDGLLGHGYAKKDPHAAALVGDTFARAHRRGMLTAIESISLRRPDLTPRLADVAAPTLLTTGTDDPMWRVADAQAAADRLPNGALVVLPTTGPLGPLFQVPSDLADLVRDFWREPSATVRRLTR